MSETVFRPWGSYTTVEITDKYQIKVLRVDPGKRLSLQLHNYREEYWQIAFGSGEVTVGEEVFSAKTADRFYIPVKTKHRLHNTGETELVITELQLGESFSEEDIVRFDDDFGRK